MRSKTEVGLAVAIFCSQNWVPDTRIDSVPLVLSKRISKPPQRLQGTRLGLLTSSDSFSRTPTDASSALSLISRVDTSLDPDLTLSAPSTSPTLGDQIWPSGLPPSSMQSSEDDEDGFSIRLTFPDGGAPTMIYPVYDGMPVTVLHLRLMTLLDLPPPLYLLVSPDWLLLDHRGTITDRYLPGSMVPCPYLAHRSQVRVHLHRDLLPVSSVVVESAGGFPVFFVFSRSSTVSAVRTSEARWGGKWGEKSS